MQFSPSLVEWQSNESKTSSGRESMPSGRFEKSPSFVSATTPILASCCTCIWWTSFQRYSRSSRSILVSMLVDDPGVWRLGSLAHCQELPENCGVGTEPRQVHHLSAALRSSVHAERAYRAPRPEALQHPHQLQVRVEDHRLRSRAPDEPPIQGSQRDSRSHSPPSTRRTTWRARVCWVRNRRWSGS